MADETTTAVAAPSAAAVIELPRSGTPEYAEWRLSGTLPEKSQEKPKAEKADVDAAATGASKETTTETTPDAEAGKRTQETRRKPGAEARISELTARTKQLERELEEARKPKTTQADSSTARQGEKTAAQQRPENYTAWREKFNADQWISQYSADHKGSSYESAYAAMSDHLYEIRRGFESAEQARSSALKTVTENRVKAMELYPDFGDVAAPMADKVMALVQNPKVDAVLKKAIMDPEGYHILYALGKDAEIAGKFEKLAIEDPAEAIYLWKTLKADVRKELGEETGATVLKPAGRDENGQFKAATEKTTTPAKRGPESAAPPPLEIGARGAGPVNESAQALSKIESGDSRAFSAWKKAEDAKELRRRRGA